MRNIQYTRHASDLGRWEYVVAAPHPALAGCVREYVGAAEDTCRAVCRRELPSEIAPVIINFGAPFRMHDPRNRSASFDVRSFATGAFDTFALVETTGPYACVQINFTILGARMFLQRPLNALANREVPLDDVLGSAGRELEMQLFDAPTWDARFDLLDRVVLARIRAGREVPAAVTHAWQRLLARSGQVAIADLARASGWSHKHFVREFAEHIGLPPKTMARVLRFGRAAELLEVSERGRLVDIANACGYYDQAHFTRDFTAFAGTSPTALLATRWPDRGGYEDRRKPDA